MNLENLFSRMRDRIDQFVNQRTYSAMQSEILTAVAKNFNPNDPAYATDYELLCAVLYPFEVYTADNGSMICQNEIEAYKEILSSPAKHLSDKARKIAIEEIEKELFNLRTKLKCVDTKIDETDEEISATMKGLMRSLDHIMDQETWKPIGDGVKRMSWSLYVMRRNVSARKEIIDEIDQTKLLLSRFTLEGVDWSDPVYREW